MNYKSFWLTSLMEVFCLFAFTDYKLFVFDYIMLYCMH